MQHPWTKHEVQIIKAAWATDAGRLALQVVVERLGNLFGGSFNVDPHVTAFNEGRRYVGRELSYAINSDISKMKLVEDTNDRSNGTGDDGRPVTATERAARAAAGTALATDGRSKR